MMITLAIVVCAVVALYLYGTRTFKYCEKRGIKHDKPVIFFGNIYERYLLQKSVSQIAVDVYRKYPNERVVGFFRSTRPYLLIRDPDIAKRILLTDFSYFYARGLIPHKTVIEPLLRNIFFTDGDLWRLLRQRMTPAFTSGKLKAMFPLIVECAERLQVHLLAAAATGRPVNARDLMARYTIEFIGACGFGLDSDSLNDENSAYMKVKSALCNTSFIEAATIVLKDIFPHTLKHLKYLKRAEKPIFDLVLAILKQRKYECSGRNDFIDLMLECKKRGKIEVKSLEKVKPDGSPETVSMELTDELIAAQVYLFFVAGFDTSSFTTSFTLHQLAYHPQVQQKVQHEIDQVLARHNNKLSYDAIKEMTYLKCTVKETMRIFPVVGNLFRECVRTYTIPELNVTIDKGVGIAIPLQALQNDPQYFDEPQEFRPERFLSDAVDVKNKCVYLPFGHGPRACTGERLGMMQSLAGLAAVLAHSSVSPAATTLRHPVIDPKCDLVQGIKGGLPLIFLERNSDSPNLRS